MVHVYFVLDYIIRLMAAEQTIRFLTSGDSILEVLTSVPFVILYPMYDINNWYLRFFMMLDPFRLLLGNRAINYIDQEITRPMLIILNKAVFLVVSSSAYIQFFESNEDYPNVPVNFTFRNTLFFIMTSVSVVGYGSYC